MPRVFTFGVPNFFSFTFRAGAAAVGRFDGTVDLESESNENTYPGATDEVEVLVPSSQQDTAKEETTSTAASSCGMLDKLPLELRTMIYRGVLKSEKSIKQAHKFLGHPPLMVTESSHLEKINAAILRTCRKIYQEAIYILYGRNGFSFRKSKDIEIFGHHGLGNTRFGVYCSKPPYAVEHTPYGRLTMIRFLTLRIAAKSTGDSRKGIWSLWSNFFYPSENKSEEQGLLVRFPALEILVLDLKDLNLDERDTSKVRVRCKLSLYLKKKIDTLYLQVTPFLKKLRPTDGLKHLTLIGVNHEQNLCDFKHGFVRQGGTFRPAPWSDKTVPSTTVSHDDLPMVSVYVRAILEKDRASRATSQS